MLIVFVRVVLPFRSISSIEVGVTTPLNQNIYLLANEGIKQVEGRMHYPWQRIEVLKACRSRVSRVQVSS